MVIAALAAAVAATGCRRDRAPRGHDRQSINVVLVTIDTLRADRVGATGGPAGLTPAIDQLARGGVVFLDATAHAPLTLPAHASILTGRYPTGHGVHDNSGFVLPPAVPTLATLLHDAGYHTGAFVSSYVLRRSVGLSRRFDVYDDEFVQLGRSRVTAGEVERRGSETARRADAWLAAIAEPFLAWIHINDPHAPYDPPPAFAARFAGRPYDGEVAASDFAVSEILDSIPAGRRGRTLVVITGDHGEGLGEHGELEHGVLVYDSTLHVPLVMAGAGVPAGRIISRQVRHVDLLPTILDIAGVKPPPVLDGESLRVAISGPTSSDAPLSYAESRFGELHFGWHSLRAARDGAWKYIDGGSTELYQVASDRGEQHDLSREKVETVAGLSRALDRLSAGTAASPARPSAEASERLRSLGYISGRMDLGSGDDAGADPRDEIYRYAAYVEAFNKAMTDLDDGRQAAAEKAFRELARTYPRAYEAHQYLGRALAARRAYVSAVAEFDIALALGPREAEVYFDAARVLAAAGRFDAAFDRISRGRALDPSSPSGAMAEGIVARAAGQDDRAARAFAEAVRLNPKLAPAHFELGLLAESRGDRTGARAEYARALDGDPSLEAARRALERVSR